MPALPDFRRTLSSPLLVGVLGLTPLLAGLAPLPSRADLLAETVRSICLTAFHREMERAGKVPPAGMADFACTCVADRIFDGTSIDAARQSCRLATVRRYPL